jgi:hypothetical protein
MPKEAGMNKHESDGNLLDRIMKKMKGIPTKEKRIKVDSRYISFRAVKRRAMRKEIEAECKKVGVTWKQAKRYMREELKQKPTLNAMHREMVGGEPC